jgi:hypothetical protein
VNPRIGVSTIIPVSGTTIYENSSVTFSGSGACSYASQANLTVSVSCLTNTVGSLQRYDGYLRRSLIGQAQFSGTHPCSGCCGGGSISVTFNNGCGDTYSGIYDVRRHYSDGGLVGYLYKCQDYWSGLNHYYKVARANLYCNGTSGSFSLPFGEYFLTLGECVSDIGGADARDITGAGGCGGSLSGSASCCWYSDNGLSGYNFRSRVYSVSGSRCCNIDTQNGAWVNSGSGNECCPVV